MKRFEIPADYDRETIVVYQAYRPAIAEAAVAAQRFVNPFSLNRMTWIKPSTLWMMHRSGWASTPGQERVVAVRITRAGWEEALSQAVQITPEARVYGSREEWRERFAHAVVRVQWDPEFVARRQTGPSQYPSWLVPRHHRSVRQRLDRRDSRPDHAGTRRRTGW